MIKAAIEHKATKAKPRAVCRLSCQDRIDKMRKRGEYELRNRSTLVDVLGIEIS
jgi:hypothetical protein